jgi:hypothetical protein
MEVPLKGAGGVWVCYCSMAKVVVVVFLARFG